ncbi:MAG: MotA/TolQ/ExbB proton channel family protein [Myxococcota bacterium]
MQIVCPHCQAPRPEAAVAVPGGVIDCEACDRSYLVPRPEDGKRFWERGPRVGPGPQSGSASPGDVGLGFTGAVAAGLTLVFFLAVVAPLEQTYFGQLFGNRGWVPYVISYLAFWSAVLLVARYRRLSRQMRVFSLDLLPQRMAERITPERAPEFTLALEQLSGELPDNLLIRRLIRALEHFVARGSVSETVDQLRLQAERDENAIESSYTMLRVFIWAIPILGFIGTVLGIGTSVGGFSEAVSSASDLDVMKDSIGVVTSGLGVAFDTTLLALVTSIFIMFPTSSLQKAEEDYLARVDEYCQRQLVSRLDAGESVASDGDSAAWANRLAEALIEALERRGSRLG